MTALILHMKDQVKGLLACWYLRLSHFLPKMKLQYKPGVANKVADTLSRAPLPGTSGVESMVLQVSLSGVESFQVMLKQIQEQQQDPELVKLMEYLKEGTLPHNPQEAKGYFVVDNILYYI